MFIIFVLSSFLIQAAMSDIADPINFSFPSFDRDSCAEGKDLICWGVAAAGDGYIDVTPAQQTNGTTMQGNRVGRVLYKYPVLAWPAAISTTFTVRISKDPNSTGSGDGMAFVMAQDGGPSPDNSYGSFLGLLNRTSKGTAIHQLGVELDTFYNNEFDPDDNHIGIDTESISSVATVGLSSIDVDLKLGRDVTVKINYGGWKKEIEIFAAYADAPLVSILNYTIALSETVPSSVYVGFTGSTGIDSESHQILNWVFNSVPLPNSSLYEGHPITKTIKEILIIGFPVVTGMLFLVTSIYIMIKTFRKKIVQNAKGRIETQTRTAAKTPQVFSLKVLAKATQNFSNDNLLGAGGFGSVYKGIISSPPSAIAVKRISATSKQGEREFLAEICTIGRLRHKNIVQIRGWCHEGNNLLLVYEFMPNGSLDRFISKAFLEWQTRYKILTGLASALLYLHEECGNTIIHRDVKPNNVMLDSDYNACLGDFGLARCFQTEASVTTKVAGTPGYLAPECTYTGKATRESDVFSFGIVVLEVVCGRRSMGMIGQNNLVDYVWDLHAKDELQQCLDGKLGDKYDEEQIQRALAVGLACSHPDPMFRPTMRKVVQILMNPNEPVVVVPNYRPSAIYITVNSSSLPSTNGPSESHCSTTVPEDTLVRFGR